MDKPPKRTRVTPVNIGQTHKMCAKCKRLKDIHEFNKCAKNTRSGRASYCRICQRGVDTRNSPGVLRKTFFGPKLQLVDIQDIRQDRKSGMKLVDIAKAFEVSVDHVSRIVNRISWRHVE